MVVNQRESKMFKRKSIFIFRKTFFDDIDDFPYPSQYYHYSNDNICLFPDLIGLANSKIMMFDLMYLPYHGSWFESVLFFYSFDSNDWTMTDVIAPTHLQSLARFQIFTVKNLQRGR